MNARERIAKLYKDIRRKSRGFRIVGESAKTALWEARVRDSWDVLEGLGLVRFRWVADEHCSIEDLEGDTYNPECHPEIPLERIERERKEFHDTIDRDGVWGLVAEYRLLPLHYGEGDIVPSYGGEENEPGWETGSSVWGFVGTDENGYESSIMSETIDCLRNALKGRCPRCRQPAA